MPRIEIIELPTALVSVEEMIRLVWPEVNERPARYTVMVWARRGLIPSVQVRGRGRRWFNPARVREALERL